MRLSSQLLLAMSVSTIVAIGATSYAAINAASGSLETAYQEKLSAIADGRRNQLETFLGAFDEKMIQFGKGDQAPAMLNMLKLGMKEIEGNVTQKLQDLYNTERTKEDQLKYHKEHKTFRYNVQYENFDPALRAFATENAIEDLYMINKEGIVVYTLRMGDEWATNLIDGPQKDSHLGKFVNSLIANPEKQTTTFGNFNTYSLMNNEPVAFVGIPIVNVENQMFFGVAVAQLPQSKIAEILNNNTGLGQTGETILVKSDGTLLSDSQKTAESDQLSTKLDLSSIAAPTGRDITVGSLDTYRDMSSMIASTNLSFDGNDWQVAAIIDRKEALAGTSNMVIWIFSVAVVAIFAAIGFAVWFARTLTRPINAAIGNMKQLSDGNTDFEQNGLTRKDEVGDIARAIEHFRDAAIDKVRLEHETIANREQSEKDRAANEAAKLAQAEAVNSTVDELAKGLELLASGDLVTTIDKAFMDDMEPVRQNFNGSVAKLRDTLAGITKVAGSIRSDSNEISSATEDLSTRTETQAASLEEASAALEELTGNVRTASEQAVEVAQLAQSAKTDTDQSSRVVSNAISAMTRIETASSDISGIINVIDEIAFQTNLLALNAGVEAARAGEAGKGFAVVAQEVRELAGRSAEAAKEIKQLINTSNTEVGEGVKLVKETGEVLEKISDQVANIETRITLIADGTKEQLGGIETVNSSVSEMDNRIQQNAAMAEETTAATMRLADEIKSLSNMVQTFRIGQAAENIEQSRAKQNLSNSAKSAKIPTHTPQAAQLNKMATAMKTTSSALATEDADNWDEF